MDSPPERIEIRLVDGFALMSFASVVEPLRAANHLAGRTLYDVAVAPVASLASATEA